jgi:superoxide dismutase, Fe-Mn family
MITRRQAIKTVIGTTAIASVLPLSKIFAQKENKPVSESVPEGPFQLPPLGYASDALEPHIDTKTMEIHHGRHHATYVKNLNIALKDHPDLHQKSVKDLVQGWESLPEAIKTPVRNNGGGHYNHSLFWKMLSKTGGGAPKGDLAASIDKKFGSYTKFQEEFTKAATKVFGSGWAWLTLDAKKELLIESTPNQDSPITKGNVPLLGIDVWEHAYYLKHQNKRADYIAAFYNVVNWDFVAERFATAKD